MDSSAENLSSAEIITSTCPNCAQPVHGVFCHNCGQKQVEYNRLIFTLINEVFGDVFTLNSRTFKTLGHLLVKPGFVSSEYSQGKRSRYLPALRLYLIASVVLALTISMGRFVNDGDEELHINFSPNASVEFDTEDRSIDGFEEEARSLLEELKFDFLSEEADKRFDDYALARILTLYQLYQVDPGQLFENLINVLFQAMFVLVPFFAVVLKSFYLRSGRF